MMPTQTPILPLLLLALTSSSVARAQDWPRFLGPSMNGVYQSKTPLATTWPPNGLEKLWQTQVGEGYSGPVVSNGKLILFQRRANQEIVQCLDAETGKELWSGGYPTTYRDSMGHNSGPRATPAIHNGTIYTFGAEGRLTAWNLASGKQLWSLDTKTKYKTDNGYFGMACSPLVDSGVLIVNLGGQDGAGIVGFDPVTGKELWKTSRDDASYSSPTAATIHGRRYGLIMTREGLTALNPKTGTTFFEFPWRPSINASVSAAVPLVIGDRIFLSVSYGTGAVVLQFDETKPTPIWSGDDVLSNHYATSVQHGGFLYGFDGRQERGCNLRCVELNTGKVRWNQDRFGSGSLIVANDSLLILSERGELIQAPASPAGFKPRNRSQILGFQVRAHPALANGLYYARDNTRLVCLNLR